MALSLAFPLLIAAAASAEKDQRCNVRRVEVDLGKAGVMLPAVSDEPIVFDVVNPAGYNNVIQEAVARAALLESVGRSEVLLSSSNSYSHGQETQVLEDYVAGLDPQQQQPTCQESTSNSSAPSTETFYLFGPQRGGKWDELLELYMRPPVPGVESAALSFGVGGANSGVAFHMHGAGFSEVLHGSKRWFLFPPAASFPWDPEATTAQWVDKEYPGLLRRGEGPLECTIVPGQLLYFPSGWHHATLNGGAYNVFISTFL